MQTRVQIKENGSGEKILVVQTSFLGDAVLTTPLLSAIRRRFPSAHLTVLCTPQAKPLLEGHPDVHEILTDDKKGKGKGWKGVWRKAKELRARGFTLAFAPHKSLRSGLLLFLAGIPNRVGFRCSAGWFFYHHRVDRDPSRHDAERMLSLLKPFGAAPEQDSVGLRVVADAQAEARVEEVFRSLGVGGSGITFGINPGSVWATKRWTAEGYAALMVRLKQKYRCDIVLFGGPQDGAVVDRIQRLSGDLGVALPGRFDLRELVCAISRCDLFITNDSAPMHIAVAGGVPVVAVFCATTPSLGFYPYTSRAIVVEKDLPCRPCSSHGGRRCPLGTEDCMRLIGAEDVLRGVEKVLERPAEPMAERRGAKLPEVMTL
ncbi:MAG: lipopolysaccharide heptosyltransferase II [Deltaproteobacteria bacterium]|nr:lipopolysaccharide heptosyltransferase II [Deltaproteobacteria bacterium]